MCSSDDHQRMMTEAQSYQPDHDMPVDPEEFMDMIRAAFTAGWMARDQPPKPTLEDRVRDTITSCVQQGRIRLDTIAGKIRFDYGQPGLEVLYRLYDEQFFTIKRIGLEDIARNYEVHLTDHTEK